MGGEKKKLVGVGGSFCVLVQLLISEKPLFGEKTFTIRQNPWPFGKTYNGKKFS